MQTQRQTWPCSEDQKSCTMALHLFLDMHICSSWGCCRRGDFMVLWDTNIIKYYFPLNLLPSVRPSPFLQGSQGSSTSLSSAKVSSSVDDGDGLVTEGEEQWMLQECPINGQRRCTCKYHACLNHVHDLWCISVSGLYILFSSPRFLTPLHLPGCLSSPLPVCLIYNELSLTIGTFTTEWQL